MVHNRCAAAALASLASMLACTAPERKPGDDSADRTPSQDSDSVRALHRITAFFTDSLPRARYMEQGGCEPTTYPGWEGFPLVKCRYTVRDADGTQKSAEVIMLNPSRQQLARWIDIAGPDDGGVVVSEHRSNYWTFSVVTIPGLLEAGVHPISGNRRFGYVAKEDGTLVFYTKGCDRTSSVEIPEIVAFSVQDWLWSSFQQKVFDYINNHGGVAKKLAVYRKTFDWSMIKLLKVFDPSGGVQSV